MTWPTRAQSVVEFLHVVNVTKLPIPQHSAIGIWLNLVLRVQANTHILIQIYGSFYRYSLSLTYLSIHVHLSSYPSGLSPATLSSPRSLFVPVYFVHKSIRTYIPLPEYLSVDRVLSAHFWLTLWLAHISLERLIMGEAYFSQNSLCATCLNPPIALLLPST